MKRQGNIGQGRAGHGRVKGRFSSGQDRAGVREVAVAGTGNDRSKGRNKDRSRAVTGAGTGTGLGWAGLG